MSLNVENAALHAAELEVGERCATPPSPVPDPSSRVRRERRRASFAIATVAIDAMALSAVLAAGVLVATLLPGGVALDPIAYLTLGTLLVATPMAARVILRPIVRRAAARDAVRTRTSVGASDAEIEGLLAACAAGALDRVVLLRLDAAKGDLIRLAHRFVETGAEAVVASEAFAVFRGRVPAAEIDGTPVYRVRPSRLRGGNVALKRAVDVVGSAIGIVLLLPLLAAIALAIKLTSPGPVLYRQERVGRGGRPFTFLKFRSMIAGAPSAAHREYVKSWMTGEAAGTDAAGRKVFKLMDDPRITRVGRFLRRTSLDELPQLLNVLRGDMSLVGPRPCMPYERELYEDWQTCRLDVLPGCTGLWQVKARSTVGFEDMVLLDLYYVAHWSLLRDLGLVALTLPVMAFGEGGH